MAEGRTDRASVSKASCDIDELVNEGSCDAYESFCDPCRHEGEWKAVKGFCQVCREYFCNDCLRVHRKQKISRSHPILDTEQIPSGHGSGSNQDLCVEVCKEHHPEIIRFHCKAHDESGCSDCLTLKHASCNKYRIQDISKGFEQTKEFKDIDSDLQQIYMELETLEAKLLNNTKTLDDSYKEVQEKIATARSQINAYLDHIEERIMNEAVQMKLEDEAELNALHAEHQEMKSEIEAMLKTLHDSNANVNTLFITTKQAKQRMTAMIKEINKMKQSQQKQYEFEISDQIQKMISTETPLGQLSHASQNIKPLAPKRHPKIPRALNIDMKALFNRKINVKCETDEKDCWIKDITLLNNDRIVVTDWNNKSVKLIDINNNCVISNHCTPSEPRGVTALSTSMIAVTLLGESNIQIMNATSTITLQREIKVKRGCWGIAYKDGKFAVSYLYPGRVHILDTQGRLLLTIRPKQGHDYILSRPYYLTFGQTEPGAITNEHATDTVIVSDLDTKEVSVVTFKGEVIRTYKNDTLIDPQGIAMASDGTLFVCTSSGGAVHAVSPDFNDSEIIINNNRRYTNPQSIAYSENNHSLYVSNYFVGGSNNNKIYVYYLKVPAET